MEQIYLVMIIAFVAANVVGVGLLIYFLIRRQRAQMQAAMKMMGMGEAMKPSTPTAGTVDGITYYALFRPAANKQPAALCLYLPARSPFSFYVKKETGTERRFKRWGINRELQIGDRRFDDAYYIVTDQEADTKRHLLDHHRRQAIEFLLENGFTLVQLTADTVQAVITPFVGRGAPDKEKVHQAVAHLARLSPVENRSIAVGRTPPLPAIPNNDLPLRGPWTAKRVLPYVAAFLSMTLGILSIPLGVVRYPILNAGGALVDGLVAGAVALALFLYLAIQMLKGRATSHYDLLIVGIFALIGVPTLSVGLTYVGNGYFDESPPTTHQAPLLDKYTTRDKNGTHYHLLVRSWREGEASEKLDTNAGFYQRVVPGHSVIAVDTREGWFGYPWVAEFRLADTRNGSAPAE